VATTVAAKHARGLEFSTTDGVAVDAIISAIETWNPSKGSLSTWVGTKAKYAVADLRRQERKQWAIKKSLYHGVKAGAYYGVKPQADDGLEKRQAHNKVMRQLQDLGLEDWLKRRKGADAQDQKIARLLFVNGMLPAEVAKAIGWSTRSVERAKARIIKAVVGKTTSAKSTWWQSDYDRPPPCGYLRDEHFVFDGTVTRAKAARELCKQWLRFSIERALDLDLRDEVAADLAANRMPRRSALRKIANDHLRHMRVGWSLANRHGIFEAQCVATILHS
jgi:DNA-directed RNA polymerase specialized sigma24 family protein